jgi:hypothetical protein
MMLNTIQFAQSNQFSYFDCDIKLHMKKCCLVCLIYLTIFY